MLPHRDPSHQNVCNKYVSGQGKGEGGEAASRTNSNGTPRARSGSQWGEGVGTAYDGSYSASSNRSNSSQSSAGSQADAPDVSDVPTQEGLGGGGLWSSMNVGMDVGDGIPN